MAENVFQGNQKSAGLVPVHAASDNQQPESELYFQTNLLSILKDRKVMALA